MSIDLKLSSARPKANFSDNFEKLITEDEKIISLPMAKIEQFTRNGEPQPFDIDENEIEALKASIMENGLFSPVVVRKYQGKYQLLSGHKRYLAVKSLYWKNIDAVVLDVQDDKIAYDILCQANIQRKEPNPSVISKMFNTYLEMRKDSTAELTVDRICRMFGTSRKTVYRYAKLSSINNELVKLFDSKKIGVKFIEDVARLDIKQQQALFDYYNENGISAKIFASVLKYLESNKSTDVYKAVLFAEQEMSEKKEKNNKNIYSQLRSRNKKYSCFTDEQFNEIIMAVFDKLDKGEKVI